MNLPGPTGRRTGLGFMLVFAFMAAGILATGDQYYRNYKRNYRAEAERQLSSIADLKVNELVQYRKERLGDANTFYNNPAFSELVRRFLDQPADADAQRQLQSWLGKFQAYYGYARINLFDVQGAERLAVPNQPEPLPGHLARDIAAVLRSGQVTFLDFHRDAPGLPVQLEILVPIFDGSDKNRPLGVLILRINPAVLLFPYIRQWPVPSQTAETLLVRREGNEAVYLNELRFQTNTALNLRIPITNTNVPAVKAALGQTGIVAGRDYRGAPVIADVRAVPDSPWFLVTRQDVAEVFAPLRARLWQVVVMIGVLLFGSAAGVGMVWRQQRVWFYRAKYETEAFRAKLGAIVESSEYAIISKNLDGIITSWNPSAERIYGYSAAEAIGKSVGILIPPGHPNELLQLIEKIKRGEAVEHYETGRIRKNSERVQVSLSLSPVKNEAGAIVGVSVISYDITERKRAEEALRAKEEAYRQLFDAGPDGVILIGPDARIVRANIAMARMYGYDSPDDLVGVCPTQFVAPSSREYSEQILRRRLNGEDIKQVEYELVRKDGTTYYGETLATILRNEDGTVTGYICITRDTTERKRAEMALKESEVRYQRITEVITDYIYNVRVADGRAVETTHGPGCLAVTGYQAKEFANDPFLWFRMVAAEDRSKVEEQARRILAGEDPPPIEHRIVQKNGTERWVRNTFVPHRDERGVLATYDGLIQDITGRKQAEEEVARTAREWQTTFDATKDAIWILDPNHHVLRSNKTAEQFFHRPCCEMIGKPCWEIVHGTTEPIPDCPFVRSCKSGQRETMDLQIGERWFEVIVDPIFGATGQYAGAIHIVSDITERKRAEERIREQAALLDAANDAIYVRSLDDAMTYWNDGAERLYGWTRAEVLGRKIHDLIQYDRDAFETAQAALLDQGYWSGELKMTDKTGKAVIVFCRWTLLLDESGRPKEVLAINTDITERKQLEANFLRAQRMEGIGALAGGIAHDLNNILQPILMTAPLLRETTGDPESREMLDTVENCAQRGANIIKQLLTFARGEPSARVPLPVRHLLNEMNKLIQETFPKNIQLRVNVPKNLWQVLGDATQIHQALMNLCVNARDAMSNGGTLTLAAENLTLDEAFAAMMPGAKPGPYICVSVADTGMGIPPEHLDRIFDPFFTTKEIGKGTGLGLATVLGIARGHGGFVRVNSQTGKGTTFELYLPASPDAKAAARPRCETLPPRAGGELILVVDDEASVRGVVRRALEKHGYQVATAAEGVEAMGLFAQHRAEIRAVLTDMMMPEMDGPSLVRALRHLEPQLPILGMTGVGEKADIKGLDTLDLLVLLTKPFNSAVLLGVLHQALVAPRQANGKS